MTGTLTTGSPSRSPPLYDDSSVIGSPVPIAKSKPKSDCGCGQTTHPALRRASVGGGRGSRSPLASAPFEL
jgi:hypothetical protein